MSAPPQYPVANCPACRHHGLAGPVVLITIGVLFLLQMTAPAWSFDQTWPILLIAIGGVKLFERMLPHRGHPLPEWRR